MAHSTALNVIVPVAGLDRAAAFHGPAFRLEEMYRSNESIVAGIPGPETAPGLLLAPASAGADGNVREI